MSFYLNNDINNSAGLPFRGSTTNAASEIITKPIEKVDKVINTTVDTFIKEPEDEEKKKSHKTAITAGSTVLVLSALIALLNPKFSGKLVNKLKTSSSKAGANVKNNNSPLVNQFNKIKKKTFTYTADTFQFVNSMNAAKDVGFKWLCTAEKFNGIKNDTVRNILTKCDTGFRKVMGYTHNSITNWFDKISKHTVHNNYNKAVKKMDSFEELINNYKGKLSSREQKILENKLSEIKTAKQYFSEEKTAERLLAQEKSMENLEKDFKDKFLNDFCKKFKGPKDSGTFSEKMRYNKLHLRKNMSYWAEDMLVPAKNAFEQDGRKAVDTLIGDGKGVKGLYNETIDILAPHITKEEKAILEEGLKKTGKKLTKANKSECLEYFDKKRDLVLGGAPTDILTGVATLGLGGIAIGAADNKEDRISRALTLGFPAIAGLGTSLTLTAMLFSGVQGMIYGSLAGIGFSRLGSAINKLINPKKPTEVSNA